MHIYYNNNIHSLKNTIYFPHFIYMTTNYLHLIQNRYFRIPSNKFNNTNPKLCDIF